MKYQNRQKWFECQLVSIWNAARFHGVQKDIPHIDKRGYRKICEEYRCINGPAIYAKKELKKYGMRVVPGELSLNWIRKNLPADLSVSHPRVGLHAVLAVDVKRHRGAHWILLVNYARNRTHWIQWSRLREIHSKFTGLSPVKYELVPK